MSSLDICASVNDTYNFPKLQPNSDVSGIGILLSFLISAYAVLLLTICAYIWGFVPEQQLTRVDKLFLKRKPRLHNPSHWEKRLRKGVLIVSDQQVVTGIAMLGAGWVGFRNGTIDIYHFQVLLYLAWMSSNVHLSTLTLLRTYLRSHRVLRNWRVGGMMVLFAMLFMGLVPTTNACWSQAAYYPCDLVNDFQSSSYWYFSPSTPALCAWKFLNHQTFGIESVSSFVILLFGYGWKICALFEKSEIAARKWVRTKPEYYMEKALRTLVVERQSHLRKLLFSTLLIIYISFFALADFAESFAASLWVLLLGLAWGTFQIMIPRYYVQGFSSQVPDNEDTWQFGQILPMLLLALPVIGMLDYQYGREDESHNHSTTLITQEVNAPLPQILQTLQPISLTAYFLYSQPSFSNHEQRAASSIGALEVILYKSGFFKCVLLWINAAVLGISCIVFLYASLSGEVHWNPDGSYSEVYFPAQANTLWIFGMGLAGAAAGLLLIMVLALLFSKRLN